MLGSIMLYRIIGDSNGCFVVKCKEYQKSNTEKGIEIHRYRISPHSSCLLSSILNHTILPNRQINQQLSQVSCHVHSLHPKMYITLCNYYPQASQSCCGIMHFQITSNYQEYEEPKCDESNEYTLLSSDMKTQVGDNKNGKTFKVICL